MAPGSMRSFLAQRFCRREGHATLVRKRADTGGRSARLGARLAPHAAAERPVREARDVTTTRCVARGLARAAIRSLEGHLLDASPVDTDRRQDPAGADAVG